MTEKSNTNVYWYILLAFILVLFVAAMQQFSSAMLSNPEITMSDEDIDYHLRIQGIDIDNYEATAPEIENNDAIPGSNQTGSQAKDFALEFFYSRSIASQIGIFAKGIFSFPSFVITLLNIPESSIVWFISILNWFWRISLILATYYLIRGTK